MRTSIYLLSLLAFMACTNKTENKSSAKDQSSSLGSNTNSKGATNTKTNTNTASDPSQSAKIDPSTAAAKIDAKIKMSPADVMTDPNMLFPTMALSLTTADYVQILRCAASFQLKTLSGLTISPVDDTPAPVSSPADRKWAWSAARNDSHNCKIVAEYLPGPIYADIAASSGSFYYIANPCIKAEKSTTGQDACSYDLSYSDRVYSFVNGFNEVVLDKAIELSKANAHLLSLVDDLRISSKLLELRLDACESRYAFNETEKALKRGFIMLGLFSVGFIVGTSLPPLPGVGITGGPGGGFMIGMLAMQMGSQTLTKLLNIGPGVDSCLQGDNAVYGTSAEEIQRARQSVSYYESQYHVKETIDHMQALVKQADPAKKDPGGDIQQALDRITKIMNEMAELDHRVANANLFIAQGNKYAAKSIQTLNDPNGDPRAKP